MKRERYHGFRSSSWSPGSGRSRSRCVRSPMQIDSQARPRDRRRRARPRLTHGPSPDRPPDEAVAYERMKPLLAALWKDVFPGNDAHYTSVIIPSVSMDAQTLLRHGEALVYEEVLLFLLIRLRNPKARVIYVTSLPISAAIREYYLQFLAGIPASHAAARLTFLCAHDGSPRPLAEKILERPRLLERIRARIPDPARAYITVLRATPLERRLALRLGIPMNAADPEMQALCTKSWARQILKEAGLEVPLGCENLRDEADLRQAVLDLAGRRRGLRRAIVKLEHSYWDEGNALLTLPPAPTRESVAAALRSLSSSLAGETAESYMARWVRTGGVVEEFLEDITGVASGQVRINPRAQVSLTSSHEEVRGGPNGFLSEGCRFPAPDPFRAQVQAQALRVGDLLASRGLVSRVSVEFLVRPGRVSERGRPEVQLAATEINLGVGGATHPLLAVRFLCEGTLDPATGLFLSPTGRPKYYRATDHLRSAAYRGLLPEDLVEITTMNGLGYSPHTESGALFYMLGALSEHGWVGLVAIGNTREEAEAVHHRVVTTLERETA